ncbi:MAG: FadR family transcriptional regulator [Chloroflexi bacterium]|nr:FadR family transcriptional regulator [Chloroflexota bacterium]
MRSMVRPAGQQTNSSNAAFTAIRRTRLFEGVVEQVKELIRDGRLRPGQKLPSERELAQRFQVSRASLREAIRALELEGLVVTRPGAGSFVSEEGFDAAVEALARRLLAGREELADVAELRLLLEPQVAALAAQRAVQEDKDRLEAILQEQSQQVQQGGSGADADVAFHSQVAAASHNQALVNLSGALADLLAPVRDETLQTPERSQASLASHRTILDAVMRGGAEAARQAMREHILGVNRSLLEKKGG